MVTTIKILSQMPQRISLSIWASSHGCAHHHLPAAVQSYLEGQSRYEKPTFDAMGGRKINSAIIIKIVEDRNQKRGSCQVHVVILGSNNLRRGQKPQEVMSHFVSLFDQIKDVKDLHIVASGVFPSPETEPGTKKSFNLFNVMLRKFCSQCPFFSYFNAVRKFFNTDLLTLLKVQNSNVQTF